MATISYTVSASAGTATSKCTVTATYSVSNSNDRTTITVSKLVAGSTSTTGGANNSQKIAARDSLKQKMDNLVIALTFDGQTVATRTGATAGSTYTSYTGSKYVTKTHSAQTKTLKFVSTTASISVPAKPSYNVTFNANSGSGAPASQTKWYGETLTLSGTKPTKSGYTFKGWATSTANAGNGTVNYASGASYTGNAALTLYAVWELTYKKPAITEVTIEHCDANGDFDDEGSYAKVSFKWSVFKSTATRYYGGSTTPYSANAPTCSITVGSYTVTPTLTESPASVVVGGGTFTPEGEYNASITVSDTQTVYTGTSNTTTVTGKLTTAEYPMDVNPTGTAIGFFCSAPNSGRGIYIYGKSLLDTFYPVGSYYETSDTTFDPNVSWGGTWVKDSAGRVTVAQDTSQTEFDTVGETGGATTYTVPTTKLTDAQMAHGHGFTQPKIPGHTHNIKTASPNNTGSYSTSQVEFGKPTGTTYTNDNMFSSSGGGGACTGGAVSNLSGASSTRTAHGHGSVSTLQPYIVVNRWHRTA